MKHLQRAFLAVVMTAFSLLGYSQSFQANPEKFPDQLKAYLGQYDKKEAKDFMDKFEKVWIGLPDNIKNDCYTMANSLEAKQAKPYPEFFGYFSGVLYFAQNNMLNTIYPSWKSVVNSTMSARDKKQMAEFLQFSYWFYTDGTVYKTSTSSWAMKSDKYSYSYENNQPMVIFDKADLHCYAKEDTSNVFGTSGILLPLKEKFEGKGGTVTWERAGLPRSETFAELKKFSVTLRSVGFDADSVTFHTPYFKSPLSGKLVEKIVSKGGISSVKYPQFQSYSKRLFIKNVFPDIDYDGGFMMQGANLLGFGTAEELAKLNMYRGGKIFMRALSTTFIIKPGGINSDRAQSVIYIEKDSISHPGLRFKYTKSTNQVILQREKTGLSQSPFFNTYHNLEMYFESLRWKVGDPVIELGPMEGSSEKTATFESNNFYSREIYNSLNNMDKTHPMVFIEDLGKRLDTNIVTLPALASHMGRPTDQIMPIIGQLNAGGFISYEPERELITIKPKLFNYLKSNGKKIDYDPIDIQSDSIVSNSNASINLLNYELLIHGVKRVTLSDSQFVRIYPQNEELIVMKNRNMKFAGIVNAGSTEFFGKEFFFNYGDFKIDLLQCDSMRLRVWPHTGPRNKQNRVQSVIRGVKGSITIDGKDNKSGVKRGFQQYPILNSTQHTYVFYNAKKIHNGVYDSTQFYFKVDPFVMDSLDNFKGYAQRFPGEFKSAGIIPVMREELGVQKDYSLGFIRKLNPEGVKLYGDKAVFKNEIRLSNAGLQADGTLSYLTSSAESKAFTLFPDSLSGIAQKYKNVEQKGTFEVPEVHGEEVMVRYHPKAKVFYAQSTDSLLHFFDKNSKMKGTMALRPDGMTGKGRMYFGTAELSSRHFKYKAKIIDADTSNFKLKSHDLSHEMAMSTENVNSHVDFVGRFCEMKSNGKASPTKFPANQYICFMDKMKWNMDTDDIDLLSDKKSVTGDINIDTDLDLTGSNFFSIHPDQDSLNFMSPKAKFNPRTKVINCSKVEYLNIADARIYPDSGQVVIRKNAEMDELQKAKIVCNYVTKYHKIYNAKVKITAKKKYVAEGDYAYVDENKMEQKIHFAKITLDSTFQTYAKGEVKEDEKFMLSPHFEYKGVVELKANDIGLNFTGATRLVHNCGAFDRNWLSFKGVVDPLNIRIPIAEDIVNYDGGGFLGAGISVNKDTIPALVYSTFLSVKTKKENPDVIKATGFLVFDKRLQEYQIAQEDKLKEASLPGNFVGYAKEKCIVRGDGKLSFGTKTSQFKAVPVGTVEQNLKTGAVTMKATVMFDFPFFEGLMEKLADKILNYPDIQPFENDPVKSIYEKSLRELIGVEKSDEIIANLSLGKERWKLPDEIAKPLVFTDVSFKLVQEDPMTHWISTGRLVLTNVYKKQIYKYIDGKIIVSHGRQGDEVTIVLKLDDANLYYFHYSNVKGRFTVYSTDPSFKSTISEAKSDKLNFKGKDSDKDFEIVYGEARSKAEAAMQME